MELIALFIIQEVSEFYNLPVKDVISVSRKKEIVKARCVSMYFIKDYTKLSLDRIGGYFNSRTTKSKTKDHATVLHAIKLVNDNIDIYPCDKIEINEIRTKLNIKKNYKGFGHISGRFIMKETIVLIPFQLPPIYYLHKKYAIIKKIARPIKIEPVKIKHIKFSESAKAIEEPFKPFIRPYSNLTRSCDRIYSGYKEHQI